ncbi:MAG: hypothetical protein WBV28_17390 [Terracidiphilus sp.]
MSWRRFTNRAEEPVDIDALDPAMKQALGDFKASVHAWSDAVLSQPRTVREVVVRRSWRLAVSWGLTAVLLGSTLSAGLYEHRRAQVLAQLAAQRALEQQHQLATQHAQEMAQQEEDLFASVDKDVSREVPSAMEPLAQLTDDDEAQ